MSDMQPRCYEDLLTILRAQIDKLGLGLNQIDEICGLPAGYAAKIFGPSRFSSLGQRSLWLLLPELGFQMALIEDEALLAKRRIPANQYEKNQARIGNRARQPSIAVLARVFSHLGMQGAAIRWRGKDKKDRSDHGRLMANARWKQRRAARSQRAPTG